MKPQLWLPVAVFLGVSLPVLLLLIVTGVLTEYRIWIALGAGMLATAFAQSRLQAQDADNKDA